MLGVLWLLLLLLLLLVVVVVVVVVVVLTAIDFSLGGSSPYTITDETNKNIHKNNTKHSTNNTKHSKHKYTHYQNTNTILKTPTYYKTS